MVCPHCGHADPTRRDFHAFDHHIRDHFGWQIAFFLIQLVGFQLLGVLISLPVQMVYAAGHEGITAEELSDFLGQTNVQFAITATAYLIVFGVFILITGVRKRLPKFFESFKNYKSYLWGALGAAVLIGFQLLYSAIIGVIFEAAGMQSPGINSNETSIREMCKAFPALCLIVFGVIGPFTEEVGYRVGLFGLTCRAGKVLAYVISALVFGFIHFNWNAFGAQEPSVLITEFVNLPAYIIPGVGLAFLYDRFGFATSFTAHSLNNLFSLIVTIVSPGETNA